jgi:hypothetical protein
MKANQEKMEDLQEETKSQICLLTSCPDANHTKTGANQEQMIAEMKARQVRMVVRLNGVQDVFLVRKDGDPSRKDEGHDKDQRGTDAS